MKDVAVLGFHDGSAGQVATWFEEVTGLRIACFVHEADEPLFVDAIVENKKRVSQKMSYPLGDSFKDKPLICSRDWPSELERRGIGKVLPLTPDNRERLRQLETCRAHGFELVSAIHPTATILPDAEIQPGVWINAGAIIGYKVEIAAGVLINTAVRLDHHNVLERCSQVDPGVVTAGHVTLRECAHVHTGVVIINRKEIGADAIVGAGTVVIRDVPAKSTVVGVPGRVIKQR